MTPNPHASLGLDAPGAAAPSVRQVSGQSIHQVRASLTPARARPCRSSVRHLTRPSTFSAKRITEFGRSVGPPPDHPDGHGAQSDISQSLAHHPAGRVHPIRRTTRSGAPPSPAHHPVRRTSHRPHVPQSSVSPSPSLSHTCGRPRITQRGVPSVRRAFGSMRNSIRHVLGRLTHGPIPHSVPM